MSWWIVGKFSVPGEGLFFPVNHFGCGGYLAIFHLKALHTSPQQQKIASKFWAGLHWSHWLQSRFVFDRRPAIESVGKTLNSQQVVSVSHGDGKLHEWCTGQWHPFVYTSFVVKLCHVAGPSWTMRSLMLRHYGLPCACSFYIVLLWVHPWWLSWKFAELCYLIIMKFQMLNWRWRPRPTMAIWWWF